MFVRNNHSAGVHVGDYFLQPGDSFVADAAWAMVAETEQATRYLAPITDAAELVKLEEAHAYHLSATHISPADKGGVSLLRKPVAA